MTYQPDIPKSGDTLGGTRAQINTNFQNLNTAFSANHSALTVSTVGKHIFMQMPEQASAPATAIDEGALYTIEGISPAQTNLVFRAENSGGGGGFQYQLTKSIAASTATFGNITNSPAVANVKPNENFGWTFLSGNTTGGGLLLQYGSADTFGTTIGAQTITFPVPFKTVFSVNATQTNFTGNFAHLRSVTTTGFRVVGVGTTSAEVSWMAIGI